MEHYGGPGGPEPRSKKTGEPEKEHSAKEKDAGLDQIATIARTLVIPLNCHHTGRLENTGSKATNTRSRDLRWPVTDSSKNSTVPNEKPSKRISSQIVQKTHRERDASLPASAVPSSVSQDTTLTTVTQTSPSKKDTRDKTSIFFYKGVVHKRLLGLEAALSVSVPAFCEASLSVILRAEGVTRHPPRHRTASLKCLDERASRDFNVI